MLGSMVDGAKNGILKYVILFFIVLAGGGLVLTDVGGFLPVARRLTLLLLSAVKKSPPMNLTANFAVFYTNKTFHHVMPMMLASPTSSYKMKLPASYLLWAHGTMALKWRLKILLTMSDSLLPHF